MLGFLGVPPSGRGSVYAESLRCLRSSSCSRSRNSAICIPDLSHTANRAFRAWRSSRSVVVSFFCSSIFSICCTSSLVMSLLRLSIMSTVFSGNLNPFLISCRTCPIRACNSFEASLSSLMICLSWQRFNPAAFKAAVDGIVSEFQLRNKSRA